MKNIFFIICLLIVGVVFYTATFRGVLGNPQPKQILNGVYGAGSPFESSHEKSPYALIIAQATYGRSDLTRELADMGAPDVSYYKGKFYSYFPPGLSFMLLPFYNFGVQINLAQVFTYMPMPFFAIFTMVVIFLICRQIFKLPGWASFLACIVYGFGTTSWGYSLTIYQHSVSSFLLVASFYAAWMYKKSGTASYMWGSVVWICYGVGILMDYPNAIILLPTMIYFLMSSISISRTNERLKIKFKLAIIVTSIFFFALSFSHLYYNYVNYGDWKKISQSFSRYEKDKFDLLMQKEKAKKLKTYKTQSAGYLKEERIVTGVKALLIDDDKGIFFYSPILLMALFGFLVKLKNIHREKVVLIATILVNLLIYASFNDPWGGWAYGPRYLIPSMAILSIFVSVFLVHTRHKLFSKVLFFILFLYSAAVGLLGALTTNVVPPKIEAIPEHLKYYNYLLNINFLKANQTGSIVYNTFMRNDLSLFYYYSIMLAILLGIIYIVLFIVPLYEEEK